MEVSDIAEKLATSLLNLSNAASLDQPGLAEGLLERIEDLSQRLAKESLSPFAAIGHLGDTAAVGECCYSSAHAATLSQTELVLDILSRSGRDWNKARSVILEWLGDDWQQQFRPVAARIKREAAAGNETSNAAADSPRLSVDLARLQATLDGTRYDVTSVQAVRWLQVLAEHPGEWIAGSDLQAYDPELDGARTDKLRQYLPPEISACIESSTGKGSRFNPGASAVGMP